MSQGKGAAGKGLFLPSSPSSSLGIDRQGCGSCFLSSWFFGSSRRHVATPRRKEARSELDDLSIRSCALGDSGWTRPSNGLERGVPKLGH